MAQQPSKPRPPHCWGFEIIFRHTAIGRTPLHDWSARSWDIYLKANNTHCRQTSLSPAGFKPAIPTIELPQTHALERAATGIGKLIVIKGIMISMMVIYCAAWGVNSNTSRCCEAEVLLFESLVMHLPWLKLMQHCYQNNWWCIIEST